MPLCPKQGIITQPSTSRSCVEATPPPVPLNIVRAKGQYIYDASDNQYLDCINSVAHVGHCHPAVVQSTIQMMGSKPESLPSLVTDSLEYNYPSMLQQTLPSHLDSLLFCHSGAEAVDLAVRLARLHTNGTDVICVENSFHGATESVHHFSHKLYNNCIDSKPNWMHFVPLPYNGLGKYCGSEEEKVRKHINTMKTTLQNVQRSNRKIACFMCEPFLTIMGCIIPSKKWLQEIYNLVHACGGLCIADEVQTGLGRIGSHFWSFQAQEVVPDIVIIGKSVGNGYPFAVVATSKKFSALLGDRLVYYKCSPVVDAIGCSVLQVLRNENLVLSAESVGNNLKKKLEELKERHKFIGEIRGQGLLFGIDIVLDQESCQPSKEVAEDIVIRLQEKRVIIASEGRNHNILLLMPPMCFTEEDAKELVKKLDDVLTDVGRKYTNAPSVLHSSLEESCSNAMVSPIGRIGILQCWQRPLRNKTPSPSRAQSHSYDDPD